MKLFIFTLLFVSCILSVNFQYSVTCESGANPCGSGGSYTFTQTAPTAGSAVADPALSCEVGDSITFNFPVALPTHPFDIQTSSGTPFPGAGGFPYQSQGSVTYNCDSTLLNQGPATYICLFHPSMTGTITAVLPGQPTAAPTNGTGGKVVPSSLTVPASLAGLTQSVDLGKDMFFYWKPPAASDEFLDFAIQAPTVGGWVGIGFSRDDNFQMRGSDAFIGAVNPDGLGASLNGYVLTTKVIEGIISSVDFPFESASASLVGGVTTFVIRRKLGQGLNPILINEFGQLNAMIIASYSNDRTGQVNFKHDVRVDYGKYINLMTGQVETAYRYAIPVRVAHGVLMGTAYALLFPLGLMVARYGKSETGTWFKVHFFLQNYAFIIMLVGIIIGYTLPELQFQSFTYHAGMGTAIFVLTILQMVMGFLRPHKEAGEKISFPRKVFEFMHHWIGRLILILAIAQIAAGILELGVAPFAYGIWVPFLIIFFIISIILEIRKCMKPKEEGGGISYKLLV